MVPQTKQNDAFHHERLKSQSDLSAVLLCLMLDACEKSGEKVGQVSQRLQEGFCRRQAGGRQHRLHQVLESSVQLERQIPAQELRNRSHRSQQLLVGNHIGQPNEQTGPVN